MSLGKLQRDGSLIYVTHFLGSREHQCRGCFNALVRTSRSTLPLREGVLRLCWPFCCSFSEWFSIRIPHNGGRDQDHVHTMLIRLCWECVDVHIGNCCVALDYLQCDGDVMVSVEYQVDAAVKKLLCLPHLPDSLIHYGVSDTLAYVVSQSLAGHVESSFCWDRGGLVAVIELWPPYEWPMFRQGFLTDTYNTRINSICAGCLGLPELAASMLFCRRCSAGAFCSRCYDLDLDCCIRCPEEVPLQGRAGNVFRMRRKWLT